VKALHEKDLKEGFWRKIIFVPGGTKLAAWGTPGTEQLLVETPVLGPEAVLIVFSVLAEDFE
jgi:hypothetical protein